MKLPFISLHMVIHSLILSMMIPVAVYGSPPSKAETLQELIHKQRISSGLQVLERDPVLDEAAGIRAREIADSFSHTRPDGTSCFSILGKLDIIYDTAGENLAYGQSSAEEALADWMASPSHKENLLDPTFDKTGIAVYESDGTYYWVQLFLSY